MRKYSSYVSTIYAEAKENRKHLGNPKSIVAAHYSWRFPWSTAQKTLEHCQEEPHEALGYMELERNEPLWEQCVLTVQLVREALPT